jgi:hypothetical protein
MQGVPPGLNKETSCATDGHFECHFDRQVAKQVVRVDILICNAGVMTPPTKQLTADGFEMTIG